MRHKYKSIKTPILINKTSNRWIARFWVDNPDIDGIITTL